MFANGAYHVKGGADTPLTYVTMVPSYGDVLAEVTVRTVGNERGDDIGLVLRADDARHQMVVFSIIPDNSLWALERMRSDGTSIKSSDTLLTVGRSDALRPGEANRLSVLARGALYQCFINGRLVGSYSDGALRAGHAGVYLGPGTTQGAFNDYAIYPAA